MPEHAVEKLALAKIRFYICDIRKALILIRLIIGILIHIHVRIKGLHAYLFQRLWVHNQPYGSARMLFSSNEIYLLVISPLLVHCAWAHTGRQRTL